MTEPSRDQFFSNVFKDGDAAEASSVRRQLSFEERVIKRAFRECGVSVPQWGRYVLHCRSVTGEDGLNFNWFNRTFPFPAMLCGKRIYGSRRGRKIFEMTARDLLLPPAKNKLLRLISRTIEQQGIEADDRFIFVFPIVQKMFCAHNFTDLPDMTRSRLTYRFAREEWHIEPTDTVFSAIGADWWDSDIDLSV